MNQTEVTQTPVNTTPGTAMLRTLGLVAAISGFLVVLAYRVTLPMIETNKRLAIERALYQVVPGAESRRDFILRDKGIMPLEDGLEGTPLYAGYDAEGQLKGIALEAAAAGYQDVIRLLYGYDPYCQCIRGIKVLKMAETPGIGDKIAKDETFQKNFTALEAKVDTTGAGLEHAIVMVKPGRKTQAWEIDAISGATISSRAVTKMLNKSGQQMIPVIMKHLAVLESSP